MSLKKKNEAEPQKKMIKNREGKTEPKKKRKETTSITDTVTRNQNPMKPKTSQKRFKKNRIDEPKKKFN